MANANYDEFDAYGYAAEPRAPAQQLAHGPVRGPRGQRLLNTAGALTSVALIGGLGVWAYDLAVRDVRGVPVIQALEGPARIAPANPGGELASYQGMAVNEIAADGTAGAPAERLTLAPRSGDLAAEDTAMGALAASAETPETPLDMAPAEAAPAALAPLAPPPGETEPMLASLRPEEPLPDGPADDLAEALAPAPEIEVPAAAPPIPADVPGVAQSPRPAARPGSAAGLAMATNAATGEPAYDAIAEAAAAAVAEALGAPATDGLDVDPTALAEGTRLVQIGVYPDEAAARLQWDRTASRFGALMDGKRRLIEPATGGGETFYRLRVEGFTDVEDARRFCAAFRAEGAECVPTAVR